MSKADSRSNFRIVTIPGELAEGLFGQIVLWTFELLPYLKQHSLYPAWNITSKLYGASPGFTVIPGVFDLAYVAPQGQLRDVDQYALRSAHANVLGGDWRALHDLWHEYFRVPQRVVDQADRVPVGPRTLGLHYRGQDKNASAIDTNAVSEQDFITLVAGFVREHPAIESLFVATDEYAFLAAVQRAFPRLTVLNLGKVGFHKEGEGIPDKADRALLDTLLLSRCRWVLKCSSALSGFAKVLNPGLEIYRVAACKLFVEIPYFPDAYVPPLRSADPACRAVLARLMKDDWLDDDAARERYARPFANRPRFDAWQKVLSWFDYKRFQVRRLRGRTT